MSVIEAANEATLLFCLPLPRYAIMACCGDLGHMNNIDEQDYNDIQHEGQTAVRKLLEAELPRTVNRSVIFNPMEAFRPREKVSDLFSSRGISIWSEDPVHLARAAYHHVLTCLQSAVEDITTNPGCIGRIDSIIPVPRSKQESLTLLAPPVAPCIRGDSSTSRGQWGGHRGWAPSARRSWRGHARRWSQTNLGQSINNEFYTLNTTKKKKR